MREHIFYSSDICHQMAAIYTSGWSESCTWAAPLIINAGRLGYNVSNMSSMCSSYDYIIYQAKSGIGGRLYNDNDIGITLTLTCPLLVTKKFLGGWPPYLQSQSNSWPPYLESQSNSWLPYLQSQSNTWPDGHHTFSLKAILGRMATIPSVTKQFLATIP